MHELFEALYLPPYAVNLQKLAESSWIGPQHLRCVRRQHLLREHDTGLVGSLSHQWLTLQRSASVQSRIWSWCWVAASAVWRRIARGKMSADERFWIIKNNRCWAFEVAWLCAQAFEIGTTPADQGPALAPCQGKSFPVVVPEYEYLSQLHCQQRWEVGSVR